MAEEDRLSSISKASSIAEMAEFWDTHDATDFEAVTHEVDIEFDLKNRRHYIAIDPDVLGMLREQSDRRGIGLESLANLWLQEKAMAVAAT